LLDPKLIEQLRKTRLEKKITLDDIYSATRINKRFLEAIEQGNFDILPKPYVRSFIKQYARYIGFDENKILAQFEEQKEHQPVERREEPDETKRYTQIEDSVNTPRLKTLFLSLAIIGGLALIGYLLFGVFSSSDEPIVERPFQEVVREIEEHAEQTTIEPVDSPGIAALEERDSLLLAVTAIDTVWLTITIDNVSQQEYIFPPGTRREWKALNDFLVTVGNAGGVSIFVNDDSIGVLGETGQVVRNLHITHDGIQR